MIALNNDQKSENNINNENLINSLDNGLCRTERLLEFYLLHMCCDCVTLNRVYLKERRERERDA